VVKAGQTAVFGVDNGMQVRTVVVGSPAGVIAAVKKKLVVFEYSIFSSTTFRRLILASKLPHSLFQRGQAGAGRTRTNPSERVRESEKHAKPLPAVNELQAVKVCMSAASGGYGFVTVDPPSLALKVRFQNVRSPGEGMERCVVFP